jgi:hypothetical protein
MLLLSMLKIAGVLIIAILVIVSAVIFLTGPKLPEDVDRTIDSVLRSELPELLIGKTGYVCPGQQHKRDFEENYI